MRADRLSLGAGLRLLGGFVDGRGQPWVARASQGPASGRLEAVADVEQAGSASARRPWRWRSGRLRLAAGADGAKSKLYRLTLTGDVVGAGTDLVVRARIEDGRWVTLPQVAQTNDSRTYRLTALATEPSRPWPPRIPGDASELPPEERRPQARVVQIEIEGGPRASVRSVALTYRPLRARGRMASP